jgi:hypothetical protein
MVWRAMISAGILAVKEPQGLILSDAKHPDGLTLAPWHEGPSVAASFVLASSTCTVSVAEAVAQREEQKYLEISSSHHFFPLASVTLGPINAEGQRFISELGHYLTAVTQPTRDFILIPAPLSVQYSVTMPSAWLTVFKLAMRMMTIFAPPPAYL